MSYMHISNLYQSQTILLMKQCFALEKVHGTSARVEWTQKDVRYSGGGVKHARFKTLFDDAALREAFERLGHAAVTVFGEAYGGREQKQSWRYGKELRFVAFEVRIGETFLNVPNAHDVCTKLGLEFVHYVQIPTDLPAIDRERDAPSEQARRNGVEGDQPREGVILRPLVELRLPNGDRMIAKHKRDEERETRTPRDVIDPEKQAVLDAADAIAIEWVTDTRLEHVLDHLRAAKGGEDLVVEDTRSVVDAMIADVVREAAGEIVDSRPARAAIGRAASRMFLAQLKAQLRQPPEGADRG